MSLDSIPTLPRALNVSGDDLIGIIDMADRRSPKSATLAESVNAAIAEDPAASRAAMETGEFIGGISAPVITALYSKLYQPMTPPDGVVRELFRFKLPQSCAVTNAEINIFGTLSTMWNHPTNKADTVYLCFCPAASHSSSFGAAGVFYTIALHRSETYFSYIKLILYPGPSGSQFELHYQPTPEGNKGFGNGSTIQKFDGCWDGDFYSDRFATDAFGNLGEENEIVVSIHVQHAGTTPDFALAADFRIACNPSAT